MVVLYTEYFIYTKFVTSVIQFTSLIR